MENTLSEKRTIQLAAGERDLERYLRSSAARAVAEVIWNSLDADAQTVQVELHRELPGGPVRRVVIIDDGHGIAASDVECAFGVHRDSPKRRTRMSPAGRPLHGRQGRGRFRTLAVSTEVEWDSVADSGFGELERLRISIPRLSSTHINVETQLESSDGIKAGTHVVLRLAQEPKAARVGDPDFGRELEILLAPTLVALDDARVTLDGELLDPAAQIEFDVSLELDVELEDYEQLDGTPTGVPVLRVIEWRSQSLKPEVFLCDEAGAALAELGGRLPKAPSLAWTAYLQWEGFGRHTVTEGDLQNARATYRGVVEAALDALGKHLQERSELVIGDVVDEWIKDGSYPYTEVPSCLAEAAEQSSFREMVGIARKALPGDVSQRKLALGMMKAAYQESPDDALQVIEQVKGLDDEEVREFRELLEHTPLSRVVRASKAIADRFVFLVALKDLLYSSELQPKFLERDHLHKLLDENPWIFGNQWSLIRSEAALITVLREHLPVLRPELDRSVSGEPTRRVDMLFSGASREYQRTRRLVVELKRASTKLARSERDQVEDYARELANSARFAGQTVLWDFWLVGSDIDDDIKDSVNQRGLPAGLYQEVELANGGSYRVWVKSWSEVINAAEESIEFFRAELDLDPDAQEAVEMLRARYPDNVPVAGDPPVDCADKGADT